MLNHIDGIYPGLQKVLCSNGLSVQAQSNYPLRTACLNRSEAATNVNALYEMAGLSAAALVYKPLRPIQITKSEQRVQSV